METNASGKCSDWKAWYDRGKSTTLHVTGQCTFPTPGYSVELKPAVPQGINPRIYILNKIVHEPTGPVPQVLGKPVEVNYSEVTDAIYDEVDIQPDGVRIPLEEARYSGEQKS